MANQATLHITPVDVARAKDLRIAPSNARLKAGIGKYRPPQGDFDHEEMPC